MEKTINGEAVKQSLAKIGWSQKRLADELEVSSQAVTNWIKGVDFPRPNKLLKLATTLSLGFEQLVKSAATQPVVAYRKRGGTKTTEKHLLKAMAMGALLKPLVHYLPPMRALRTQISAPSVSYEFIQSAAAAIREKIGIGAEAVLLYEHLIDEFQMNDAVIVPVMWGSKQQHGNALHIFLPEENVTFIYLNLDTYHEDFKFWMAHELAHVYTQDLAGKDEGENFADALAGALLFPRELARKAYVTANHARTVSGEISALQRYSTEHRISLYSVFCEVRHYAKDSKLPQLQVADYDIHAARNHLRGPMVSESLFNPVPPEASRYVATTHSIFKSSFFNALQKMLRERNTGAGYVQQVLDISLKDATALCVELMR